MKEREAQYRLYLVSLLLIVMMVACRPDQIQSTATAVPSDDLSGLFPGGEGEYPERGVPTRQIVAPDFDGSVCETDFVDQSVAEIMSSPAMATRFMKSAVCRGVMEEMEENIGFPLGWEDHVSASDTVDLRDDRIVFVTLDPSVKEWETESDVAVMMFFGRVRIDKLGSGVYQPHIEFPDGFVPVEMSARRGGMLAEVGDGAMPFVGFLAEDGMSGAEMSLRPVRGSDS